MTPKWPLKTHSDGTLPAPKSLPHAQGTLSGSWKLSPLPLGHSFERKEWYGFAATPLCLSLNTPTGQVSWLDRPSRAQGPYTSRQ